MRDNLEQYVNLLFAGASDCEDIRQEILLNTLDRYDDLIAQGKVPEAAYRLALAGIGDINEILGTKAAPSRKAEEPEENDTPTKKILRAVAVGLYILCPIPLILLSEFGLDILGVCILLFIVAAATFLIILGAKKDDDNNAEEKSREPLSPGQRLRESIDSLIGTITLILYLVISFVTRAWSITWVIFLISGAVKGLVNAILDLKEAKNHEN